MRRIGPVTQFKVCRNEASHLRGNVYVQFALRDDAVKAQAAFTGRYYASMPLSPVFVPVTRWRSAICGFDYFSTVHPRNKSTITSTNQSQQCSHGNLLCNFLHVFPNLESTFDEADMDRTSGHHHMTAMKGTATPIDSDKIGSVSSSSPSTKRRRTEDERDERDRRKSNEEKRTKRNHDDDDSHHHKDKRKERDKHTRRDHRTDRRDKHT